MKKSLLALIIVFLTFSQSPVFGGTQEEIIRLQSDILQLQEQIRLLQKVVDEKNSVIQTLLEQLNDQFATNNVTFSEMVNAFNESRTRSISLSDNVTSVKNDVARLSTRLDEINSRLAEVQRKFDENQMQVQTLRSVPSSGSGDVDVEPDRVYSASYNDYLVGNYALAINGFQDFITSYPDSEYADNASYYLGDCYLQQKNLDLALKSFEQTVNLFPGGDKTSTAYYKMGQILMQQNRMDEAISTLKKLEQLFPGTTEARLAAEDLGKWNQ
jgi:tol-pal system protein YbgF